MIKVQHDMHMTNWNDERNRRSFAAYLACPLITDLLKEAKRELSDAIWEEDQEKVKQVKWKIQEYELRIRTGEKRLYNYG